MTHQFNTISGSYFDLINQSYENIEVVTAKQVVPVLPFPFSFLKFFFLFGGH